MWPAQLQQSQDDDDGSDKCFPSLFRNLPHPYHHYTPFSIGWGSMLTFKDTHFLIPSIIGCHHDFTLIYTQFGRKRHCPVRKSWRTVLKWSILTWGMFDTCSQPRQMMLMICASKFSSLLYWISFERERETHQDHQESERTIIDCFSNTECGLALSTAFGDMSPPVSVTNEGPSSIWVSRFLMVIALDGDLSLSNPFIFIHFLSCGNQQQPLRIRSIPSTRFAVQIRYKEVSVQLWTRVENVLKEKWRED